MGMPAAKRRRLDFDDSFDDDPEIVNKNTSPNDSFDDEPIEEGPPLVAARIFESQALKQNDPHGHETAKPSTSNELLMEEEILPLRQTEYPSSLIIRPNSPAPSTSPQTNDAKTLTGGTHESGVVLMMKRRNENLTRQLEEVRREKAAKDSAHYEEKRRLEKDFKKQIDGLKEEKKQIHRQLMSMSFRQENLLNMTAAATDLNHTISNKTAFIPTKPIEKTAPTSFNRTSWMKQPPAVSSKVFTHPKNTNAEDTYVHISTQMMESSILMHNVPPAINRNRIVSVTMVDNECQTIQEENDPIIEPSKREAVIDCLLNAASKMDVESFTRSNLQQLCINDSYKPLQRRKPPLKM